MKIWLKILLSTVILFSNIGFAQKETKLTEEEAFKLATEVYIYAYPLVTMEMTKRVMTNVSAPQESSAPIGQFANMKKFPDANFKDVTAPNADTLYSAAWVDLSKEPYILHIPNEKNRYYLMPILSGWTNVIASPGKRTLGPNKESNIAIVGPRWKGTLPKNVSKIKSPTDLIWILGRTYSTGTPEDYSEVRAIQGKYSLTPLSAWSKSYLPPTNVSIDSSIDMKTPPREQVNNMDAAIYYKIFAKLLMNNPPAAMDASMVKKLTSLGLKPSNDFELNKLDPSIAKALQLSIKSGQDQILKTIPTLGKKINGWQVDLNLGTYGKNYAARAAVAYAGLGANLPQDAVYPMTVVDSENISLNGNKRYVLHFAKGETPPTKGFWSLTMYNNDYYFVANPLNRYNLNSRDKFKYNADGSLDLFIQQESPGKDKEANWLPAPQEDFKLMLRLYWPDLAVLQGKWLPPAVKQIK